MTTQATASDQNAFVGIDFGTTKTMVASYDPGKKSAKPLTFGRGKFEKPTSMYATETGDLLFGDDADDEGITDVLNHIRRFKLKLGNPDWKHGGRKSGTAAQLTTEFLASLRSQMNNQVLHTSVDRVVLTVPAMFGPAQRHDLTEAARKAGFYQVELLEEPVAAGIAYCDHQSDLSKQLRFIVVDWGGGTFDVAHLERFSSGDIKVYEDFVVGLDDIGGEVFDDELWSIALNALSSAGHGTLNYENLGRYRRDLSRAKETLSSQASVSMTFALTDGEPAKITLNRADFNDIISPLIQKAASFVSQLLVRAQNAGCPPEFILLAGGTSRIPLIAEELERITGVKCLQWSDGREAIALGAAIRAHQLWGQKDAQKTQDERVAANEKQAAKAQYKNLLEGAWIDGIISYEERVFLGKKRKELDLTIEESEAIQILILGDLISHIAQSENDTVSPTKSNSGGFPNPIPSSSQPGYSERKFNCPNAQCGKEMILTPDEFASKTYKCPYCKQSGSFSPQKNTNTAQKEHAADVSSKLQRPIVSGNVTPPIEVREIQKIIRSETNLLPQSNFHDFSIYIENIPPEKLRNAILSYAYVKSHEVILFHDATVFGSAKEGIVLTSSHVFWKDLSDIPRKLGYDEITSLVEKPALTFLGAGLMVNGMPMTPQGGFHAKALAKCVYRMLLRISNYHKTSNSR